jgi:tetratricopeptide (TPR) repeat protein
MHLLISITTFLHRFKDLMLYYFGDRRFFHWKVISKVLVPFFYLMFVNFFRLVWNLREQVCIAALELNDLETAETTIQVLDRQFPKSARVGKLKGMLLEAKGNFTDALTHYETLIKEDCSNITARKRKVAIYKAQHDVSKMIQELNSILHNFPSDGSCWLELAELYLILNDYDAACHCYEELILSDPRNAHFHCRLGEILYSMNSTEKILNARKHFTISLTIQNIHYNLRAVNGLILCCKHLHSVGKSSASSVVATEK